jgi:hypothetical protein
MGPHVAREMDDLAAELRLRSLEPPYHAVAAEAAELQAMILQIGPEAPSEELDRRIAAFLAERKKPAH